MARKIGFIILVLSLIGTLPEDGLLPDVPTIFVMSIFAIIGFILVFKKPLTAEQKIAKEKKRKMEEQRKAAIAAKPLAYAKIVECKLFTGLPVPKNTDSEVTFGYQGLLIKTNAQTFDINYNKIIRIDVKTDEQIRTQYVSSVGGAIAGAELFGPLGALIGGSPQQVQNKTVTTYLIITYYSGNTVNYASFVVKPHDVQKAPKLVAEIKHRFTAQVKHTSL